MDSKRLPQKCIDILRKHKDSPRDTHAIGSIMVSESTNEVCVKSAHHNPVSFSL